MTLRWYQNQAVHETLDFLFSTQGRHPVVAMPTGTGKSHVISAIAETAMYYYPNTRILMMVHVKELVKQNLEKLEAAWPTAPVGVFSAGLKRKEPEFPIVYGGTKTIINGLDRLGRRDLVFCDECHLMSHNVDTTHRKIIDELMKLNPNLRVIGLSASPYRQGLGLITGNGLFTDMPVNQTSMEWFARFIAEGFMVPLIPKRTQTQLDVSNVGVSNGEFTLGELARAVDVDRITYNALSELVQYGHDRTSWLIACSGVEHAEHCAQALQYFGVSAVVVHANLGEEERDRRLAAFKIGQYRAMCVNNIATVGFDHPPIDLIGVLRPTLSTSFWVQLLGRGTRPSYETMKQNCLVLDFANNTLRLGPINDPVLPRLKGKRTGDAPVRICDNCGTYNHASARFCISCGVAFEFSQKFVSTASTLDLMRGQNPETETYTVQAVYYERYEKDGSPDSIKVRYQCGLRQFNEWVCLEHIGFPRKKSRDWWRQRHYMEPPETTSEALEYLRELRMPKRITVWINKQYPEILGAEF